MRHVHGFGAPAMAALMIALAGAAHAVPLPSERELARNGYKRVWYSQVGHFGPGEWVRSARLISGRLYVVSNKGRVSCINGTDGTILWETFVGRPADFRYGPTVSKKYVAMITGTRLVLLSPADGHRLADRALDIIPSGEGQLYKDWLYLPCADGSMYGLDLEEPGHRWFYRADGAMRSRPVAMLDYVAFASEDGHVYSSAAINRNLSWRFQTDAMVTANMAAMGAYVVAGSQDYSLYALHIVHGKTLWTFRAGGPILHAPVVVMTDVYLEAEGQGLFKIDGLTGEMQWNLRDGRQFVAASPKTTYVRDYRGRLLLVESQSGKVLDTLDTSRFDILPVNREDQAVYLLTKQGLAVCLRDSRLTPDDLISFPRQLDLKRKLATQTLSQYVRKQLDIRSGKKPATDAEPGAEPAKKPEPAAKEETSDEDAWGEDEDEDTEETKPKAKPKADEEEDEDDEWGD